jgi:hypothetical protein
MGDRGRKPLPAAVETRDDAVSRLLDRAGDWIDPYWNAEHLRRTLAWLLVLDPGASEGARIAALTHDMERHFPGGPKMDPATMAPDDVGYRCAHCERSAQIVGEWLRGEGGSEDIAAEVDRLILTHEIGGRSDEDVLQAADSLSFLEVNAALVASWFTEGRCTRERSREQLEYMFDRIRIARARELAGPLRTEALAVVDRA